MMALVGIAVDGIRLYMVQMRLQGAVDAAGLIAARDIGNSASSQNATNLFWANFQRSGPNSTRGFLGTNITSVTVTKVNANTASVQAQGLLPTTFMNIVGVANIPVNSVNQSTRATTGMELALVLDNTGSMAGWPIQAVVSSATQLVNDVYGAPSIDTQPNLFVSVVPFTAEVSIGSSNTAWLKSGSYTAGSYLNGAWKGCVMARYDTTDSATGLTNDFTDVPPGTAPFTPFLYASTYKKYTVKQNGKTVAITGDNDWTATNITENQQATLAQNTAVGPNLGCPQTSTGTALPILPETASQTTVLGTISQMVANFRGGTFINLGLQAGWWTLSPRWRGAAGWGNATLPLDYNTPNMQKVIVLMTDGNNQWYDWPGGAPGAGPSPWVDDGNTDYTAYGRLLDNNMGLAKSQNTAANATANINTKMSQMCTLIKQQGIIIYTILFNHDGSVTSDTETMFENCASSAQDYFLDATATDLQTTFSTIGSQLASLRVSQ